MSTMWEEIRFKVLKSGSRLNLLIGINIAVFLVLELFSVIEKFSTGKLKIYNLVFDALAVPTHLPTLLKHFWTPITSMFMHAGISHIFYNMLWFYFIGQIFEEFLGGKKLLTVYLLGGLAGTLFFITAYNIFPVFATEKLTASAVGASASIMAVIVGIATLLPDYSVSVLFLGFIRLKWIALFYVVTSLISIAGANAGGEFAHLGGALLGFIYIKQLQQGNDWGAAISKLVKPKPKLKIVVNNIGKSVSNKPRQEDIDRILDKILHSGIDSLSKQEKEILSRVSSDDKS